MGTRGLTEERMIGDAPNAVKVFQGDEAPLPARFSCRENHFLCDFSGRLPAAERRLNIAGSEPDVSGRCIRFSGKKAASVPDLLGPLVRSKHALSDPDLGRRHLDEFIGVDPLEGVLQGDLPGGH